MRNQNSIKRRIVKKTVLIAGEGADEREFCLHLKRLYATYKPIEFNLRDMRGGSPKKTVEKVIKFIEDSAFEKIYGFVDSDRAELEDALILAKENKITLICSAPLCLEGLLLTILGKSLPKVKKSKTYKSCLEEVLKGDIESERLEKFFPKSLLEQKRKSIYLLDQLIKIFEG